MGLESIDPVVVNFAIKGLPDVERALDRLMSLVRKAENNNSKVYADGAKARVRAAKDGADEAVKLAEAAAKKQERIDTQLTKTSEAEAKKRAAAMKGQWDKYLRDIERSERAEIASQKRITRETEREAEKRAHILQRESSRRANVVTGSLSGTLSRGGMLLGAAAGIGGGFALSDIVQKQFSAEKQAALLVNLVTSGGKVPEGANVENILSKASKVSVATGISKDEVMQSMLAYAQNAQGGDFKGIMENVGFISKFSGAFGADSSEVASGLGALQSQNQSATPEALKGLLLSARAQSVAGVMSVRELVPQLGNIGAATAAFGGDTTSNQRQLMALMQLSAKVGPHGDAGTYVKDFGEELVKKRDKAEALGVKFTKGGKVESIEQAISAMFTGSKGNLKPMLDLLGARGGKVSEALAGDYEKGAAGKTGAAAVAGGVAEVMKAFHNIADAGMTEAQLNEQHAKTLETNGKRVEVAFNAMRETMADKLGPTLTKFATDTLPKLIPVMESAIEGVAKFIEFFANNPASGIGLLMAASVTKDIAGAMIGDAVTRVLTKGLVAAGADTSSAISKAGGNIVAAMGIAAAAIAAYKFGAAAIDKAGEEDVGKSQRKPGEMTIEAGNLASRIKNGTATSEEMKRAEVLAQIMGDDVKKGAADGRGKVGFAGGLVKGLTLGVASDAVNAGAMNEREILNREADAAKGLQAILDAIKQHGTMTTDAFGKVTPGQMLPNPNSAASPGTSYNPMVPFYEQP